MDWSLLRYYFAALLAFCAFLLLNLKNLRILKRLAPFFDGSLAFFSPIVPALDGEHRALKIGILLTPKFAEVRGTLKIRLFIRPVVQLRVMRGIFARWAFRSGLFSRVESGQPEFDAAFRVFSRQEAIARSYLQPHYTRRDLEELFGYGFSLLVIDTRSIWTEKIDYDRKADLDLTRLCTVLDILRTLAAGVPRATTQD